MAYIISQYDIRRYCNLFINLEYHIHILSIPYISQHVPIEYNSAQTVKYRASDTLSKN